MKKKKMSKTTSSNISTAAAPFTDSGPSISNGGVDDLGSPILDLTNEFTIPDLFDNIDEAIARCIDIAKGLGIILKIQRMDGGATVTREKARAILRCNRAAHIVESEKQKVQERSKFKCDCKFYLRISWVLGDKFRVHCTNGVHNHVPYGSPGSIPLPVIPFRIVGNVRDKVESLSKDQGWDTNAIYEHLVLTYGDRTPSRKNIGSFLCTRKKRDKEKQAKPVAAAEEEQQYAVKKARVEQVDDFLEEGEQHHHHQVDDFPEGEQHHHHHEAEKKNKTKEYHFFKIIFPDKLIELPKKFVNKFGTELGDVAFAVAPNGTIWRIELKKTETMIWFENGWDKFMDYYSISVGHLLVFKYEGNSVFHVIIFDMSATEIEYPISGDNKDLKFNYMELNHERRLCMKSSQDAIEESDDSVEILDNTRFPSVNRDTVKIDTDTERESSDTEQTSTTYSQRPWITFYEQFMNQTNGRALDVAKAFKSKNPVCLIVVRPTHLYNGPVNVPMHFVRKYLIEKTRSVILSVKQRTWSVGLYSASIVGNCYGRLTSGWSDFASDNHLKDGDVCVFELIEKKCFRIQVHIF